MISICTGRTWLDALGWQQLQPGPVVVPLGVVAHAQQLMQRLAKLRQAEPVSVVADVRQQQRNVRLRKRAAL
jgi:hypothetical protein